MATPTLDEIEAQIRTLCGEAPTHDGYVRGDVEAACNIALALVAHVRALGVDGGPGSRLVGADPWWCSFKDNVTPKTSEHSPAPPWCPLRVGDVVVSAK